MAPTTIYNKPKPWAWSYSKLKNFEQCPQRHYRYEVLKDVKEPESDQLKEGFFVHEQLARRIGQDQPLIERLKYLEPWAQRVLTGPGKILVEQKLALKADFSPCGYFDHGVWYRGVGDVIKIIGRVGLIIDWKTGKIIEDSVQLMLMAACVFAHYPEVEAVRSEFVWLNQDATTREDFKRNEMAKHWVALLPRIQTFEQASAAKQYPPKPGFLCRKWCAVSDCPHNGE